MAVYAGFEYPASYVEDALLTDGRSVASPLPLDAADAPPSTRPLDDDAALVQSCIAKARSAVFERTHRSAFAMLPSFAYELVRQRLNTVVDVAIRKAWDARRYDHLEFYSQWVLGPLRDHPKWLQSIRVPAKTGRGWNLLTGGSYVTDVVAEIQNPSLADHGVVYLPCFVCEYTMANSTGPYNCFVSGIDSSLVAVVSPKPSRGTETLSGLLVGGPIGVLVGYIGLPLGSDLLFVGVLAGGALGTTFGGALGTLFGRWLCPRYHRQEYIAKTRREGQIERHQKWMKNQVKEEAFWQGEVERVLARA
eukprot:g8727.t1